MGAEFVHDGVNIDYTPIADTSAGDVVVQGDLVGVANRAIDAGELGSLAIRGVFDFPKATGAHTAIAAGANVYWDSENELAVDEDGSATDTAGEETDAANEATYKLLGKAIEAAAIADSTVRVALNQ